MPPKRSSSPRRPRRDNENQAPRKRQTFLEPGALVDLNDAELLRRFVTEFGKIIPARISGVTNHQQRQIKKGVRRARNMGLLA